SGSRRCDSRAATGSSAGIARSAAGGSGSPHASSASSRSAIAGDGRIARTVPEFPHPDSRWRGPALDRSLVGGRRRRCAMRPGAVMLVALASAAALACADVRVRTDFDSATDFSTLKTFAWLDPPLREETRAEGGQSGDPFTQNTLLDKRVRDEVEAWLRSHGYRAAGDGETPDFLIRYELVSREVTRDSPVFVTGGYGGWYGHGYGYGSGVG